VRSRDHGHTVGHRFELGDGETVGDGGEDEDVRGAVIVRSAITTDAPDEGNVAGCRSHSGGGDVNRTGNDDLDRAALEEPCRFEQVLDPLPQNDASQPEDFERTGSPSLARRFGRKFVGQGDDLDLGGRDTLLDQGRLRPGGIHDHDRRQVPLAGKAFIVEAGNAARHRLPTGPLLRLLVDQLLFRTGGVDLVHDREDAVAAQPIQGLEAARVVTEVDVGGGIHGLVPQLPLDSPRERATGIRIAPELPLQGARVAPCSPGLPEKSAQGEGHDFGRGQLAVKTSRQAAHGLGPGLKVVAPRQPRFRIEGRELATAMDGSRDRIVFPGTNLSDEPTLGRHQNPRWPTTSA